MALDWAVGEVNRIILDGGTRSASELSRLVRAALDKRLGFALRDHLDGADAAAASANLVFGDYYHLASRWDGHPILTPEDEARLAGLGRTNGQLADLRRLIRHTAGGSVLSDNHLKLQLDAIGFSYQPSSADADRQTMLSAWRDAHYRAPHLHDAIVQSTGDPVAYLRDHGHHFSEGRVIPAEAGIAPPAQSAEQDRSAAVPASGTIARSAEPLLLDVLDDIINDIIAAGKWSAGTGEDARRLFRQFAWVVGNLPVTRYTQHHVSAFLRELIKLPKSVRVQRVWHRTYAEAKTEFPALTLENTRSGRTINKDLAYLSTIVTAMIAAGHWRDGQIKPLLLSHHVTQAQKSDARPPWTIGHIEAMFRSPIFVGNQGSKRRLKAGSLLHQDAAYWVLALAWWTLARREEICGLLVDDVVVEGTSTPHLIIRPNHLRGLKSPAARRFIPFHPKLIELGFLDYVEALRAEGETCLFHELWLFDAKRGGDQYYALVWTKLMAWLRQQPGVVIPTGIGGKAADIHSIRSSGLSELDRSDINQNIVADLAGHARKGVTAVNYQNLVKSGGLEDALAERLAVLMRLPDPTTALVRTTVSILPLALRSR